MKYFTVFALMLVIFVVYTKAQGPDPEPEPEPEPEPGPEPGTGPAPGRRCRSRPRQPACSGQRDEGRTGRGCRTSTMWYYNRRDGRCLEMRYLGCGGNRNRFCSLRECERRCTRF